MQLGLGLGLGSSAAPRPTLSGEDDVPRKYLFIDGGFFKRFVEEMKVASEAEIQGAEIDLSSVGSGYDRVLFYDALPERKDNQTDEEFDELRAATEDYFDEISRTRNFSVRPALTKGGRRQEQKGVDVLLAIECLLHAVRNNIDEATIMASDLDFFPLFEALLQTKTKSMLRYQIGKTSPELIRAADYAQPLTGVDFVEWLSPTHHDLRHQQGIKDVDVANGQVIAEGTVANKRFELKKTVNGDLFFPLIDGNRLGNARKIRFLVESDVERQLHAPIKYGRAL